MAKFWGTWTHVKQHISSNVYRCTTYITCESPTVFQININNCKTKTTYNGRLVFSLWWSTKHKQGAKSNGRELRQRHKGNWTILQDIIPQEPGCVPAAIAHQGNTPDWNILNWYQCSIQLTVRQQTSQPTNCLSNTSLGMVCGVTPDTEVGAVDKSTESAL